MVFVFLSMLQKVCRVCSMLCTYLLMKDCQTRQPVGNSYRQRLRWQSLSALGTACALAVRQSRLAPQRGWSSCLRRLGRRDGLHTGLRYAARSRRVLARRTVRGSEAGSGLLLRRSGRVGWTAAVAIEPRSGPQRSQPIGGSR